MSPSGNPNLVCVSSLCLIHSGIVRSSVAVIPPITFPYNVFVVTIPTANTALLPETALTPVGLIVPIPTLPSDVMRTFYVIPSVLSQVPKVKAC